MRSLLTCLFVLFNQVALGQLQTIPCAGDPGPKDPQEVLDLHNAVREGIAKRSNTHDVCKRQKSYECPLQAIASLSVMNCKCDKTFVDPNGYSISCDKVIISGNKPAQIQDAFETTIKGWRDDANDEIPLPLSAATYTSKVPETFANMIYYKSLKMGCAYNLCSGGRRAQIACVYSKKPQSGEPLYIEASTTKGCTTKKCKELVADSECDTTTGLCTTDKEIDESTTTSIPSTTSQTTTDQTTTDQTTSSQTTPRQKTPPQTTPPQTTPPQTKPPQTTPPQTTPPQTSPPQTTPPQTTPRQTTPGQTTPTTSKGSSGCMTDAIRDQVVSAINEKRLKPALEIGTSVTAKDNEARELLTIKQSALAKGQVQNGPKTETLPKATNMYKMSYDTALENEAQTYANTCPPGKSDLSTRTGHGETTMILDDTSVSCADALKNAMDVWWNEITKKALNSAVKYTQVLEQSVNAPTNFTQMAWAASYKVGCGVNNCNYGTIVVCRYYVRGNIYSQYIYRIGPTCGHCSSSCSNGLCKAPN